MAILNLKNEERRRLAWIFCGIFFAGLVTIGDVATCGQCDSHNEDRFVNQSGDTMTGNLTVPRVMIEVLDFMEILEPSTPPTNTIRLYTEVIKGFGFLKYYDDTGMKREVVRDSMILVKNVRGTTIAANRIVYATGSDENVPTVDLAKADSIDTMPAIGVTIESIANGSFGRVMQVGLLEGINTAALSEGDLLMVSDSTAGVPTTTAPITPSLTQEIGTVLVSNATAGAIQIVARGLIGDEYGTAQDIFIIGNKSLVNEDDRLNITSEVSILGVSAEVGQAVCVKADGTLGTCTDQPDAGGACTCS
jgi:hypothetical protein